MRSVAPVAPGKRASIAARTANVAAAVSGLANVICVVTAVGVVAAGAREATAVETDAGDRFGVLANQLLIATDATPAADDTAAALMADVAAAEATAPCAPTGKVSLTAAVVDPGAISTVTAIAPGKRESIAACTAAESAALSGLANVI
jgi:hypothetical protein